MSSDREPRPLTRRERDVLVHVLLTADFVGADQLREQIASTMVVGGIPTLLHLEVPFSIPPSSFRNGPIPTRALAEDPQGRVIGEILVWVSDGYLSGLEHAWVTDEPPSELPPPSLIRVEKV